MITRMPPICAMTRLYAPKNWPTNVTDPPQPTINTSENPATNKRACRSILKRVLSIVVFGVARVVDIISPASRRCSNDKQGMHLHSGLDGGIRYRQYGL